MNQGHWVTLTHSFRPPRVNFACYNAKTSLTMRLGLPSVHFERWHMPWTEHAQNCTPPTHTLCFSIWICISPPAIPQAFVARQSTALQSPPVLSFPATSNITVFSHFLRPRQVQLQKRRKGTCKVYQDNKTNLPIYKMCLAINKKGTLHALKRAKKTRVHRKWDKALRSKMPPRNSREVMTAFPGLPCATHQVSTYLRHDSMFCS